MASCSWDRGISPGEMPRVSARSTSAVGLPKGKRAMQIHPLESGIKPPDELKDLHFGDVFMLVREATVPPLRRRRI